MIRMDKKDKVLVTGGTGFLGAYILRELINQGFQNIHAIRRKTSDMRLVNSFKHSIQWHTADLLDVNDIYHQVQGASRVIHAAGLVSFAPEDKEKVYDINIQGTENIVNACLHHKIPRLIHLSSIAAIAKTRRRVPITEETKWVDDHHISQYGRSKQLGEMEVWRGVAEGLDAVILNPSIILGAGDWNASSCRLFMQIHKGLKYYPPGGTGFVDVRDVAKITVSFMTLHHVNQRYIINQDNYSFKYIFQLMARHLDVDPPSISAPKWVASSIVFLEKVKSKLTQSRPVITRDSVRNAYQDFNYDNQKIKLLGFTFTPIEQTIEETCHLLLKSSDQDYRPYLLSAQKDPVSKNTA